MRYMTAVAERSIEEGRLNYVSSSIRCNYLFYAVLLFYNYLISFNMLVPFNKILNITSFSWYYLSGILKTE